MENNALTPVNTNDQQMMPAVASSASENAALAMAAAQKATVEARYKMALARPRDLDKVRQDMLKDAQRPSFANVAIYHKPIGKGVEGPSIRFVEAAIRNMTNILTETATVSEDDERRVIRVAVSDLETNTYFSQDVTVTKTVERSKLPQGENPIRMRTNSYGKPVYILHGTDDDILNKQNSLISKAVRTLGLRLIPGDLVDEALYYVRQTMAKQDAADPDAAKNRIIDAFAQLGVPVEALKDFLGHDLSSIDPAELQLLRSTYSAIKDGETTWKAVMDDKAEREAEAKAAASASAPAPKKAEPAAQKAQARNDSSAKKASASRNQPSPAPAPAPEPEPEPEFAEGAEPEGDLDNDMFG